jgi:hypothetical protein
MLGELRSILPQRVIWFGCSVTLDLITEGLAIKCAGFRPERRESHYTYVIRILIDRLDVSICVYPIPRGSLLSPKPLYFLLNEAVGVEPHPLGSASLIIPASSLDKVAKVYLVNRVSIASIINHG